MINIRTRLMLLMLLALSTSIMAQDYTEQIAIPNAPTAAALGKYGDIPVSLHSGVPQISIPIFEATGSRLSVPISLSYHAGGIKVEEIASWVGLGWSLNAGGVINRQVIGLPDTHVNGFPTYGPIARDLVLPVIDSDPDHAICQNYERGTYDSEPDVFSFNFPGGAGQFIFDHDETSFTIIPHKKYKIELDYQSTNDIQEIVVTTDDGTKYIFSDPILTSSLPPCRQKSTTIDAYYYNSSWYLTKIISANALDEVDFTYSSPYTIVTNHVTRESHVEDLWYGETQQTADPAPCNGDIKYEAIRLTKIETSKYTINFKANSNREDLPHPNTLSLPADKRLDEIEIRTVDDVLIKRFNLDYGYFTNSINDAYNKRLKLESIEEEGNNAETKPAHTFSYNTTVTLPSLKSKDQDGWGFYNGKGNTTLIPNTFLEVEDYFYLPGTNPPLGGDFERFYSGADRTIDEAKSKFAQLTRITYPTGGYTTFGFESNDFDVDENRLYGPHLNNYEFDFAKEPLDNIVYSNFTTKSALAIYTATQIKETIFTTTFEQNVSISGQFMDQYNPIHNIGTQKVELFEKNGSTWSSIFSATHQTNFPNFNFDMKLPAKEYKIVATSNYSGTAFDGIVRITAKYYGTKTTLSQTDLGGLRVNNVTSYTSNTDPNPIVKAYKYTKSNTSTLTSGLLRKRMRYFTVSNGGSSGMLVNISSHPSSGRNYSPVYYTHVIELQGTNGENGRTEYDFIDILDFDKDQIRPDFYPFPQATSYSWAEGLNLNTTVYNDAGNKVSETVNTYSHTLLDEVEGYKFASTTPIVGGTISSDTLHNKYISSYKSGYSLLTKSESYTYDLLTPANSVKTTTEYSYDNFSHLNKTKETVTNSKAENQVTKYLYAQDVTGVAGTATLITDNIISIPLEVQQWIDAGTTKRLTSASKTAFNGDILPEEVWQAELSDPLSFTSASPPDLSSYYERRATYDFDNTEGILLEFEKEDGTSTAFIWGYDKIYPIAKVDNATQQDLINVLGSGLNNGTAGLTAAQITSLKTALPQSLITTFVYDKRYGVTSITDPNGLKIEYFYDEFGRLSHTKDQDGNILTRQDYNYNINNQSGQ